MTHEQIILDYIENEKLTYIELSHLIHQRPELGNEEIFASRTLIEDLESMGLKLKQILQVMLQALLRVMIQTSMDQLLVLAEYDALPGLGHACGHNIIGTASTFAGIALKHVIEQTGGKIVILGCPAEEGGVNGSAKAAYVKEGIIDELDVALMVHPGNETYKTINTLAVDVLDIKFYGKSTHASENAEEARNALDAMITYFNGVAQLRQHIKKSKSSWCYIRWWKSC